MKRIKYLLLLVTIFTLFMSIQVFAETSKSNQEAVMVSKEDIPNIERTLIGTTSSIIDQNGNSRPATNAMVFNAFSDVAVVTHSFYDRGYDATRDSHFYEVFMTAKILVSDSSFSRSVFAIKPKNNTKYIESSLFHSQKLSIADSIYYGYPGDGPSNPTVYAKETLYLYGESAPLYSPIDYMSRPLQ